MLAITSTKKYYQFVLSGNGLEIPLQTGRDAVPHVQKYHTNSNALFLHTIMCVFFTDRQVTGSDGHRQCNLCIHLA